MRLSNRAALLILPVVLASYLVAALGVYQVQKQALLGLERARLNKILTELEASFVGYSAFADSYLFAMAGSDKLRSFLTESDDRYREVALGLSLQNAYNTLSSHATAPVSFALVSAEGQLLFSFENGGDPFSDLSQAQRQFAAATFRKGLIKNWQHSVRPDGRSLIQQSYLLDRRTFAPPLPIQLERSVAVQIAVEPIDFDRRLQRLKQQQGATVRFSSQRHQGGDGLFAQQRLAPGLYIGVQLSRHALEQQLNGLVARLAVGILLLGLLSALLLLWLVRRFITRPVGALERQLAEVMRGGRRNIERPTAGDEIGQLGRRFHQLYEQLSEAYQRARRLSRIDSLTGLPNRNHFYELMERALDAGPRPPPRLALLYIGLDNFKFVNDKHGHQVGDALLKAFAERVRGCLAAARRAAGAGGEPLLARLAGDEFAVLLDIDAQPALAARMASQILQLCAEGGLAGEGHFPLTASIGIARYPEDGRTLNQLVSNADAAMYQAKAEGRNRYAVYSSQLAQAARRAKELEQQLRELDGDREFRLAYMPIVDRRGQVVGCETLLRWQSPQLGAVGPAEFIPIAERCGLYSKIDRWVVRRALADFHQLQALFEQPVILSVNLSSAELASADIERFICQQAQQYQVPFAQVELELTETFSVDPRLLVDGLVQQLRRHGFRIAIDDFGTGYTSLLQMIEYPVDKIKLDRTTVERLMQPEKRKMLQPIIGLCHSQQIEVTAEGVETEQQYRLLCEAGCDYLQGYYFGKPMLLEQLQAWQRERVIADSLDV